MTVITTERLTPTVGVLVEGVDHEQLLHDESLPVSMLEALEDRGVLHRAAPYDASFARDLRRTTFAGDEPIR